MPLFSVKTCLVQFSVSMYIVTSAFEKPSRKALEVFGDVPVYKYIKPETLLPE